MQAADCTAVARSRARSGSHSPHEDELPKEPDGSFTAAAVISGQSQSRGRSQGQEWVDQGGRQASQGSAHVQGPSRRRHHDVCSPPRVASPHASRCHVSVHPISLVDLLGLYCPYPWSIQYTYPWSSMAATWLPALPAACSSSCLPCSPVTLPSRARPLGNCYFLPEDALLDQDTLFEILSHGHTRIPIVSKDDSSRVVAILFSKDLVRTVAPCPCGLHADVTWVACRFHVALMRVHVPVRPPIVARVYPWCTRGAHADGPTVGARQLCATTRRQGVVAACPATPGALMPRVRLHVQIGIGFERSAPISDVLNSFHAHERVAFVPQSTKLNEAMDICKRWRQHLLMVVDATQPGDEKNTTHESSTGAAPGPVVGVATMEDFIEELIQDEIVDETDAWFCARPSTSPAHPIAPPPSSRGVQPE